MQTHTYQIVPPLSLLAPCGGAANIIEHRRRRRDAPTTACIPIYHYFIIAAIVFSYGSCHFYMAATATVRPIWIWPVVISTVL